MPPSIFNSLLLPDLRLMLEENDAPGLKEFCEALFPGISAEVLEGLAPEQAWRVLSHSNPPKQAEVFSYFSLPFQVAMVDSIDDATLSRLIEEMSSDDRVDLLERMDPEHVERLLPLLAQAERAEIRKMLSYPDGSAGAIMTTEYASLPSDITAQEALERLRLQAPSRETIYYIYITDEARHLVGFVSLRKLIQSKPATRVSQIMDHEVISVRVEDDQEHVANEVLKYGFIAIPVIDPQNRLVGIVTHDDVAEVLQEEATEDAYRLAAVAPMDDGYFETPFLELCWKRGMWLVILLGAASITAQVIQFLEGSEDRSWMVLFLPMVLASGGNAGSQSATLVIRALALNDSRGQVAWIAWREARIGAVLGTVLASLALIVARVMVGAIPAFVVGTTIFCVVTIGTLAGAMLPLGLKRLRFDPALMSNPLIASLSDMLGVVIYFNAANAIVTLF